MDDIKTGIGRQKYWSELDSSEKVERLRKEVKYLRSADDYLRQMINLLKQHRHDSQTGLLMVELEDKYQCKASGGFGDQGDDVYI